MGTDQSKPRRAWTPSFLGSESFEGFYSRYSHLQSRQLHRHGTMAPERYASTRLPVSRLWPVSLTPFAAINIGCVHFLSSFSFVAWMPKSRIRPIFPILFSSGLSISPLAARAGTIYGIITPCALRHSPYVSACCSGRPLPPRDKTIRRPTTFFAEPIPQVCAGFRAN